MIRATFAGFTTALSALQANQKRLDIVGQNLSNMNTTGYTRQTLDTSSMNYTGTIAHYMNGSEISVGFGTSMNQVSQIRDPYLDAQYRSQMGNTGYTDSMQTALDSLSKVFDETSIDGIRAALADIQSVLTNLQDPSKVNDSVYQSELRVRMENFTNLLNNSATQIEEAREQEYQRLDGEGTNENGAEQTVNDLLRQIGELNRQIKYNQAFGQPCLELMDDRNVLIDELAGYIPIEVTYYQDGTHPEDSDWPDDLRVDMVYQEQGVDGNTVTKRLTLVDGTEGVGNMNYGQIDVVPSDDEDSPYLNTKVVVTAAASTAAEGSAPEDVTITSCNDTSGSCEFDGGSIQASLDMLGGYATEDLVEIEEAEVRGYQYYMNQLNNLAGSFATVMNELNILGNGGDVTALLLVNKGTGEGEDITAANIGINQLWNQGKVQLGMGIEADGNNPTDTALAMLQAMSKAYSGSTDEDSRQFGVNLGGKSFADYINNVSTVLATDSASNQNSVTTNVTLLNGIQDSRDSVSGVSLDEEAANMMIYMSAYNAASRLMTTMDEMLDTLINSTGLVGL